ncbi:hypothetical protein HK105_205281 [Polyrhizophydium stewartii]|uniref:DUF1688 family protein n=1 Tax=Polyrhizophydium stewartii TaxID=2732419 RepID=A0ABR4N6N0_9FUNG
MPRFFGPRDGAPQVARPGNLVDYLIDHPATVRVAAPGPHPADPADPHPTDPADPDAGAAFLVPLDTLWDVVMRGFGHVWPAGRAVLDGVALGDVWECRGLAAALADPDCPPAARIGGDADARGLMPFHKLSQWLTYSLMEPLELAGIRLTGLDALTGLAEYRNGGFFVDYGVLALRPESRPKDCPPGAVPSFHVHDDVIVEWRALTVALLDITADLVREQLGLSKDELPLPKVLEAGTWKAGREIAARLRPDTGGPPIDVISDGTVF